MKDKEPTAREVLEGALDDVFGQGAQSDAPRKSLGEILELLPPQVFEYDLLPTLNSDLSDSDCRKELEKTLVRFEADLLAGGVVPSYLAWALIYARQQQRGPS